MKNIRFHALLILAAICLFPLLVTAADNPPAESPAAGPRDTEAPPEAAKPPDAVNGLKMDLTVLNAPLYPGDDLQLDIRLTNTQKEGDIQLVDYGMFWIAFQAFAISPDGQQITWPMVEMLPKPPEHPTATLPPGSFYGRKMALDTSQMRKPGRYAISIRYSNGEALKDRGFNCWTGNLQSNTAFFEVPDFSKVEAVDGIKMLVKAQPQYKEGEPVMVEVRLYNAGEKDEGACVPNLGKDSTGKVTDAEGKEVDWKIKGLPASEDSMMILLASGHAMSRKYDLRTVCDLPVGKYKFQLHSNMPWAGIGEIISNSVSFEILPAEKPKEPEAPVKDGMQLLVKMASEKYGEKDPLKLTVTLKNVSEAEKEVYTLDDEFLLYYCAGSVLKNADGKQMPWTIKMYPVQEPPFKTEKLAPGKELTKEYDLRSVADLPPGKYTMQMRPHLPTLGDMVSNEVTFEILPAEKPKDDAEPKP